MKKVLLLGLMLFSFFIYGEYVPKQTAIKMLEKVSDRDFPKSDSVYIQNETTTLNGKCLGATITENYRKILTEKARKNNSVQFRINTDYQEIEVQTIEIIKPDRTVIPFDPAVLLKEKDDTSMGGLNIYSNLSKVKVGELPDVQVGDIIFTRHKIIIKKTPMEKHFFGFFGIEDLVPYLNKYKKLILPGTRHLYIYDLNNNGLSYQFSKENNGDDMIYQWNVNNIPIIVHEPHMESYHLMAHHMVMTTIKSWEEISRWYYHITKPHMKVTRAMKKKARELTKGAKTRKEKLTRIFYWIANKVRYLGVDREKYRPGFEPHDVSYTFDTRGGVCRDKAALLAAMFRIAGIKSDVILISAGYRLNFKVPVLWFNHAITVSYDPNGQPEYIYDPTNENTKDFLPKYMEDNTYLIASKKGDTLRLTPVSPPEKNNSTLNIQIKLDDTGQASGMIDFLFSGFADTVLRNHFASLTPHEIKNMVSSIVKILHPNTELVDFEYADYSDKTKNMSITTRIDIPDYTSLLNEKIFSPFDAINFKMHLLYNYIMAPFNLSVRRYDFKMDGAFSLDIDYEIDFPSLLESPSIPEMKAIDFMGFKTSIKSQTEGKNLRIITHFETSQIHFKKEQFLAIKEKIAELFKNDDLYIITDSGGKND